MRETLLALYEWVVYAAVFAVGYLCGRETNRDPPPEPDRPIYMDHAHGGETE